MISREDVKTAIRDLDMFVAELGDSPMGGQHLAAKEWNRAKDVLLEELRHRESQEVS